MPPLLVGLLLGWPNAGTVPGGESVRGLIALLGSPVFAERESAARRLDQAGEQAITPLQRAARENWDPDVRRRAGAVAEHLIRRRAARLTEMLLHEGASVGDVLDALDSEGISPEAAQHLVFRETIRREDEDHNGKLALERYQALWERTAPRQRAWRWAARDPLMGELSFRLAQAARGQKDYDTAARAFRRAERLARPDIEKALRVADAWAAMASEMALDCEKQVRDKLLREPAMQELVDRYPLVVLHSRRYAGGHYFHSAYNFAAATADESCYGNRVHLLFDNGGQGRTFEINLAGDQRSVVADLGTAEFTRDPPLPDPDSEDNSTWSRGGCEAQEGHVYLERVRDGTDPEFSVLFQVVAVDADSRYLAFVWRRLAPGGDVARR